MRDMTEKQPNPNPAEPRRTPAGGETPAPAKSDPREIGGPKGPEPTRYGDWEYNGRCIDF
jgi:hypothetical protein